MSPIVRTMFDLRQSPQLQRELPGIVAAFDHKAMGRQLEATLFGGDSAYVLRDCEVDQATLVASEGCIVRYEVSLRDRGSKSKRKMFVTGRVFPDARSCTCYMQDKVAPVADKARRRGKLAGLAAPVAELVSLQMVVYAFPIDPELPALLDATEPAPLAGPLMQAATFLDGEARGDDCQIEVVDYGRLRRCTLRYTFEARDRKGVSQRLVVYGKVAGDGSGARAHEAITSLHERVSAGEKPDFRIPRSFGYYENLQLLLLEAIPGSSEIGGALKAKLKGEDANGRVPSLDKMIEVCGSIAAALHGADLALGRRRPLEGELDALGRRLQDVGRLSPELARELMPLFEKLQRSSGGSRALEACLNHGDFTTGQVLFDGGDAGLIDFDSLCQAEPALDIGQFLAYLRVAALKKQTVSEDAVVLFDELEDRLLEAYVAACRGRPVDKDALRARMTLYKVASLLRRALRSWEKFKENRVRGALRLLYREVARLY
jgi:hypothetical protein